MAKIFHKNAFKFQHPNKSRAFFEFCFGKRNTQLWLKRISNGIQNVGVERLKTDQRISTKIEESSLNIKRISFFH